MASLLHAGGRQARVDSGQAIVRISYLEQTLFKTLSYVAKLGNEVTGEVSASGS